MSPDRWERAKAMFESAARQYAPVALASEYRELVTAGDELAAESVVSAREWIESEAGQVASGLVNELKQIIRKQHEEIERLRATRSGR